MFFFTYTLPSPRSPPVKQTTAGKLFFCNNWTPSSWCVSYTLFLHLWAYISNSTFTFTSTFTCTFIFISTFIFYLAGALHYLYVFPLSSYTSMYLAFLLHHLYIYNVYFYPYLTFTFALLYRYHYLPLPYIYLDLYFFFCVI